MTRTSQASPLSASRVGYTATLDHSATSSSSYNFQNGKFSTTSSAPQQGGSSGSTYDIRVVPPSSMTMNDASNALNDTYSRARVSSSTAPGTRNFMVEGNVGECFPNECEISVRVSGILG